METQVENQHFDFDTDSVHAGPIYVDHVARFATLLCECVLLAAEGEICPAFPPGDGAEEASAAPSKPLQWQCTRGDRSSTTGNGHATCLALWTGIVLCEKVPFRLFCCLLVVFLFCTSGGFALDADLRGF